MTPIAQVKIHWRRQQVYQGTAIANRSLNQIEPKGALLHQNCCEMTFSYATMQLMFEQRTYQASER